jgi:hypothetical protein
MQSFVSVYHIYSVITDNILMWICKCNILYEGNGLFDCVLFMEDGFKKQPRHIS